MCWHSLHVLQQARSTFDAVQATAAKFGLHTGNIKFDTQSVELINIRIMICTALPVRVCVHHVHKKAH